MAHLELVHVFSNNSRDVVDDVLHLVIGADHDFASRFVFYELSPDAYYVRQVRRETTLLIEALRVEEWNAHVRLQLLVAEDDLRLVLRDWFIVCPLDRVTRRGRHRARDLPDAS